MRLPVLLTLVSGALAFVVARSMREPARPPSDRPATPWRDTLDITPVNGNGLLVYPGPQGPIDSIRWECIRDGIEDYGYLALFTSLRDRLAESQLEPALLDRANKASDLGLIIPDLVTFPRDPRVLLQKRHGLAQLIIDMRRILD